MSHQNMNSQIQNLVGGFGPLGLGPSRVSPIDTDILNLRRAMIINIFNILQQKQPPPADDDALRSKYMDVAIRLEKSLFKIAVSKEDYMNMSTLKSRLASLVSVSGGSRAAPIAVDTHISNLRRAMQIEIFNILQLKQPPPADDDALRSKYMDVAIRLEKSLFIIAASKDDYMNRSTLETRLASIIKSRQRQLNNNNQRQAN